MIAGCELGRGDCAGVGAEVFGVWGLGGRGDSGCGTGFDAFLSSHLSKKPFWGFFGASEAFLFSTLVFMLSCGAEGSVGLLEGPDGIFGVGSEGVLEDSAFLARSAALQRSWISFSTSARVLPYLVAE